MDAQTTRLSKKGNVVVVVIVVVVVVAILRYLGLHREATNELHRPNNEPTSKNEQSHFRVTKWSIIL